ncbi:hypothetical protein [Bacillus sp. JJ722]|uniref:hypothetical protein n=1 Tax=Bacillus sp. JJ722 TaxID=3122973 RepID=UPI002FFDE3AE
MMHRGILKKNRKKFIDKIPQKRVGEPKEAVGIFNLASPLSNYVNGQVLQINGCLYTKVLFQTIF